jgi:hypothetical protein
MSRKIHNINENISVAYGADHALGQFIDIMDRRYAESGKDEQGEGYLVEWCGAFQFSQNHIDITLEGLKDEAKIIELCDKFVKEKL